MEGKGWHRDQVDRLGTVSSAGNKFHPSFPGTGFLSKHSLHFGAINEASKGTQIHNVLGQIHKGYGIGNFLGDRNPIEPTSSSPRRLRRDYDFDDVFCPSFVERDAYKSRSMAASSTTPSKIEKGPVVKSGIAESETIAIAPQSDVSFDSTDNQVKAGYSLYVDAKAERDLLISMGWQENSEEGPNENISQQEIDDFFSLLQSSSLRASCLSKIRGADTSYFASLSGGSASGSSPTHMESFPNANLPIDDSDASLSVDEDD